MFLEQQVSILDCFLKDHVTLKTGELMLKIQLWSHSNILHFSCVCVCVCVCIPSSLWWTVLHCSSKSLFQTHSSFPPESHTSKRSNTSKHWKTHTSISVQTHRIHLHTLKEEQTWLHTQSKPSAHWNRNVATHTVDVLYLHRGLEIRYILHSVSWICIP